MAERKYTQKQIDALAGIADAEFIQALYPYTKDRPLARLGLDAHLFETGQIDPDNFKQKLLNIKQYPTQRLQRSDGNVVAGRYLREEDTIKLFADAFIYKDKTTGETKIGKGYSGPGQIETLLHELEHRGYKLLQKIVPLEDYGYTAEGFTGGFFEHMGMDERAKQTAKDLGMERETLFDPDSQGKKKKKEIKNIQKEREKKGLKSSRVKKRFPSIKQYNRGGKVYANQPRKVKVRG
jgi:hypothetical protein